MGVTLSEVGTGPDGHGQLVSWSGDITDGQQEIANASAYPLLRLAVQGTVGLPAPTEHAHLVTGSLNARPFPSWFKPSPANVGSFSAVCWMFGRRLQGTARRARGLDPERRGRVRCGALGIKGSDEPVRPNACEQDGSLHARRARYARSDTREQLAIQRHDRSLGQNGYARSSVV